MANYRLIVIYMSLICPILVFCQQRVGEACSVYDMLCELKAGLHCSPKPRGVCQECGHNNRRNSNDFRIVGGKPTDPKAWPWMAGITKRVDRDHPICGGTLITDLHVLTAAHCVIHFNFKDLIVRLGEHDFSRKGDNNPVDFEIEKVVLHDKYDSGIYDNDIALVTLRTEAQFNEFIWPACLPLQNLKLVNQVGLVAGWGTQYFEGPTNSVLHEAPVKIWPQKDCIKAYAEKKITDNMMCCGWAAGKVDSCHGDSGGPLMIQLEGRNRWILAGIVSWGRGCASKDLPGVYVKLMNYLDWIEIHTTKGISSEGASGTTGCDGDYEYFKEIDWCVKISSNEDDIVTWSQAPQACAAEGGTFAIVDTTEKQEALTDMMKRRLIPGVWIGLSAHLERGKFVWIDGTPLTTQSFSSWGKGQPDDAGQIEDCIHFSAGWDYKWNDQSCDSKFKYVCEKGRRSTACPQGYIYFRAINWCVKPSKTTQIWKKVPEACEAEGGTFAVVDTKEKHEAVINMMRTYDIFGLWIGLNDVLEEGKFVWIDGSLVTNQSFSSWGEGQPDDAFNREDCVHISSGWNYKWNDEPCNSMFRFLCERKNDN